MDESRRNFLKIASLSAVALGTVSAQTLTTPIDSHAAPLAITEGSYTSLPTKLTAKRWAMVIDTRKFNTQKDFQRVIDACHIEHNVPTIPNKQNIKWIWQDTYAHTFTDDTNRYLPEKFIQGNFLLLCNHCENPPCVKVCPTGATFKNKEGMVVMDPHRCIGCRYCMAGCPYGARSFNFMDPQPFVKKANPQYPMRTRGVVEKCTFCPERLAIGKPPACVEASNGTILFGDLNDPNSDVRQALAQHYTIRRKPTLGTEPGVYYII